MIDGDEWRRAVDGPAAKREPASAPTARRQTWTVAESDAVEVAFKESRGSAARFVAAYNELTDGKTRTSAELYFQLQRVAKARAIEVDALFYAGLDDITDGRVTAVSASPSDPEEIPKSTAPTPSDDLIEPTPFFNLGTFKRLGEWYAAGAVPGGERINFDYLLAGANLHLDMARAIEWDGSSPVQPCPRVMEWLSRNQVMDDGTTVPRAPRRRR